MTTAQSSTQAPESTDCPADISVIIPCLNEEDNVFAIAKAVIAELEANQVSFDITFIDNASTDRTVPLLRELCAGDPRIRAILNNRNYGQMRSPTHAIYQTTGRAVIGIGADFQDPPPLISEFIQHWRAGAKIVLGVRAGEKTPFIVRLARQIGYGVMARFGDYPVIPNATGFGLYDREVVDCVSQWREPEPFFRGMLVESGFSIATVPYLRPGRAAGETKNNVFTIFSFALSGLASSSKMLLRMPFYAAFLSGAPLAFTLLGAAIAALTHADAGPWLLASLIEFNFILVFGFLGLMGEQIRLISERTRGAALVNEKERINFPPASH